MVSRSTKHKVVDVLHAIADGEVKVEVLRQVLAEKYNFEPYTAFKRIALPPSSNITSQDIQEFLQDNKVFITSSDAYDIVKLFDGNKDGKLSYSEFLNAVLPKTDASLRQRATSRQAISLEDGERLPYEIEYALARIFEEELRTLKQLESLKKDLSYSYDYTNAKAFGDIDYDNKNYLIPEDIADFTDEVGRLFNEKHIDALYRRLDKDLDNRINYSEFLDAVTYSVSDIPRTSVPRSPTRTSASPRRREASPRRSEASPRRREASPSRVASPRHSRQRSTDLKQSHASPIKSEIKDLEYSNYLSESRRRSASPRRVQAVEQKEVYSTPTKSPRGRLEESTSSLRKKSPLKALDEDELVRSFKQIINSTKLLESTKNDLALRFDFNLFDGFRFFDIDGNGAYINAKQLEDGLADLKIFPTKDQVSLLFKKFGKDYYGYLRFNDICNLLTPKSAEYARILDNKKPRYVEPNEDIFTIETERLLARVFDLAIENEAQAESIRQRLSRRPLFNTFDAFKAIDKYNQGFIVLEDLKEILEDNGIFATNKDVNLLVERFKGPDAYDGKISFSEFSKELSPKSYKPY